MLTPFHKRLLFTRFNIVLDIGPKEAHPSTTGAHTGATGTKHES